MPDLRYLKVEPLPLRKPMTLPKGEGETAEPTIVDVMTLLEEAYAPTREWGLTEAQHRILNKVMDAMEKPDNGYCVVDDKEFAVIRVLVQNVAVKLTITQGGKQSNALSRNSSSIVDWLDAAPHEKPKPVESPHPENGVVEEAEKVAAQA